MSKKASFFFLLVCSLFAGINHLLNQDPSEDASASSPQGNGPVAGDRQTQVVQKMAEFVESRPQVVAPRVTDGGNHPESGGSAPSVAGYPLNQATAESLESRDGLGQFHLDQSGGQNLSESIQQVNQAWSGVGETDFDQRRALLGMTRGLAGVSDDPSLRETMLREYDLYQSQQNPNRNPDYAGQALQDYLDHETDEARKMEELKKRGIPVYRIPASTGDPVQE